jgi:hypothetical protein
MHLFFKLKTVNDQNRKSSAVHTPNRSSPRNRKAPRIKSPVHQQRSSRKYLFSISAETDTTANVKVDSELSIDDLDLTQGILLVRQPSNLPCYI